MIRILLTLCIMPTIPEYTMPDDKPAQNKKQDLVFTRTFDAPVEKVWKAWTEPAQVMQWWGPNGFSCPVAKLDVRKGGTTLVCMRASKEFGGQDMYSTWKYTEVEPNKKLDYLHNLSDKDGNSVDPAKLGMPADFPQNQRHLVTFKAVGDKTELTITEYEWPEGQMKEFSKLGMNQCLDKMAAMLAKQK